MELDPIEIRIGTYFEYRKTVKEIALSDLEQLSMLLLELKPIMLTPRYLIRLNFVSVTDQDNHRHFQKYTAGLYFNIYPRRAGKGMMLYVNDDIKLPEVRYIHQLQNVYYDLTGDVLKRTPPGKIAMTETSIRPLDMFVWNRRSGPGKYRTPK